MKHLLAVAVVALGLLVSCGSDDSGLSVMKEEADRNFADMQERDPDRVETFCQNYSSPGWEESQYESILDELRQDNYSEDEYGRDEKNAQEMMKYTQGKCSELYPN